MEREEKPESAGDDRTRSVDLEGTEEMHAEQEEKENGEFVNDCMCQKKQTALGIGSISIGIMGFVIASLL